MDLWKGKEREKKEVGTLILDNIKYISGIIKYQQVLLDCDLTKMMIATASFQQQ